MVSVCTLHNPNPNKDLDRFNQTLSQKIEQEEADDSIPEINLAGVEFPDKADFSDWSFNKPITFAEAIFSRETYFMGARFGGEAYFVGAQFSGVAVFMDARFGREADFMSAGFGAGAEFSNVKFGREAVFKGAQFGDRVNFTGSQFGGRVDFTLAQFGGRVDFALAQFTEEVSFGHAQFGGEANFMIARIGRGANFSNAQFGGPANFVRTAFPPKESDAVVRFHGLTPESGSRVRLERVDLSRVSFLRTDVSQTRFVGCDWNHRAVPLLWPLLSCGWPSSLAQQRSAVYTEVALDGPWKWEDEKPDHRLVAELYRQLRLNYEANRQEAEAGHFYIGQMEMRRQDTTYHWLYRLMLAAYRVLAMYGESYLRPPFFYFLFGLAFALAYLWGGLQVGQALVKYDPGTLALGQAGDFFKEFVRAYVQALTAGGLLGSNLFGGPMGASLDTTSWWVPAVRYVNMLLDTFLVGFFVIALRRHFQR